MLTVLVAQWIGSMAMRDRRTGAWWTMVTGTVVQTLGTLSLGVALLMLTVFKPSGGSVDYTSMLIWSNEVAMAGNLVFTAGFALHGLTRRAASEREKQLETMTAAMAEELRILRERVG